MPLGSGGIFPRTHATEYLLNHRIEPGEDFEIGEPHYLQAQGRQVSAAPLVVARLRGLEVLTAIDFHDESRLRGVEVDDILAQRLLPVELNIENLFSANHSCPN
jgi:hypothetical protein